MSTVYHLKASEINPSLIEEIKAKFGDKYISIIVFEGDETAYLLQSEINKIKLLKAIENAKQGRNLVEVNIEDLQ